MLFLPPLPSSGGLADLIPAGSAAAHADATRLFGYPLEAGVAIVQRDPRSAALRGGDDGTRSGRLRPQPRHSRPARRGSCPERRGGARPRGHRVARRRGGLLAGAKQHTSTIVTYLDFRSDATLDQQASDARADAARYLTHVAGVTGPVAAQDEQGQIINRDLGWVELFTVLAIALIVGVRFRSVLAPVAALACAGAAYVLATRIAAWGAQRTGIMLFLRALLAPVYLPAASMLAVLATLGLTVVICDAVLGSADLVYFVPFAAGVLLVSLGSCRRWWH